MIPFIAALAVMGLLVEVQDKAPKEECPKPVYTVIYKHVVDGPFPVALTDSVKVYRGGEVEDPCGD